MMNSPFRATFVALAMGSLAACGSSSSVSSTPGPLIGSTPASPAGTNDTSVELLDHPATQEFAVATYDEHIRIRYDASQDLYEIKGATFDWASVIDPPNDPAPSPNSYFDIAGQAGSYLSLTAHYRSPTSESRYRYSNIASWRAGNTSGNEWGNVAAFGTPTPATGVPLNGTARYDGVARGIADVPNSGWGEVATTPLSGTVELNFNFGTGALSGSLTLSSACDCTKNFALPTLTFANMSFAPGSQAFSGDFATTAVGANAFDGLFTGPGAEELIGRWTVPFLLEGTTHQAWGAWIAKKGN